MVWGMIGPRYARFGGVPKLLRAAPLYFWKLGHGRAGAYIGLNPAGALMLVAALALVLISAISGWMQITLRFFGVDWVQDIHTWSSYSVLVLSAFHVLGVVLASILQRQNLPAAMIIGRKRRRKLHISTHNISQD